MFVNEEIHKLKTPLISIKERNTKLKKVFEIDRVLDIKKQKVHWDSDTEEQVKKVKKKKEEGKKKFGIKDKFKKEREEFIKKLQKN